MKARDSIVMIGTPGFGQDQFLGEALGDAEGRECELTGYGATGRHPVCL